MAYVRFSGPDGVPNGYHSNIYMFEGERGIECCGCQLMGMGEMYPQDLTPQQAIAHVKEHRRAGHAVPDFVEECLETSQEVD